MVALASRHDLFRLDPPDAPMKRLERIRLMDWHTYAVHERVPTAMRSWADMSQGEYDFTIQHWMHLAVVYRHRLQHLRKSGRWMQFKAGEYAAQLRKAQNQLNAVQNDLIAIQAAWRAAHAVISR
jgi:hypothetical protein